MRSIVRCEPWGCLFPPLPSTGLPPPALCPRRLGREASPAGHCGAEEPAGSMGGERHAGLASGQPCVVPADFALLSSGRGSTRALGTPGRPSPWPLGCGEARETAWGSWVRLGAGSCPTASRLAFGSHLGACWAGGYPALPSASEPPQLLPALARRVRIQLEPVSGQTALGTALGRQLLLPVPTAGASQPHCRAVPSHAQRAPSPRHVLTPRRFHQPRGAIAMVPLGAGTAPALKVSPGHGVPPWGPPARRVPVRTPRPCQRCRGACQPQCPPHARLPRWGAKGPRGRGD